MSLFHHSMAALIGLYRYPIVSRNAVCLFLSSKTLLVYHGVVKGWVETFEDHQGSCTKTSQGLTKAHWMLISRDQVYPQYKYMFETMLANFSELVQSITVIPTPFISKEKEYSYIFVWLSKSVICIISYFQNIKFPSGIPFPVIF